MHVKYDLIIYEWNKAKKIINLIYIIILIKKKRKELSVTLKKKLNL